jgi:hypothetical protein
MVEVYKTSSGTLPLPADPPFTFEIREGATTFLSGTVIDSCTADITTGFCDFGGTMFKPGNYQFCEVGMMPGWSNNLNGFTPDAETPEGGDNSSECVDFPLNPGETKVFNIDNTPPPGGDARTIGFWKNWTSCDGHGNQDPVLDTTLYSFPSHGVSIGLLFVDSCMEGVNILNKSTQGGDKKANDAAYSLAAQLLAAKLNVQAGAGTCAAVTDAIAAAQTLLVNVVNLVNPFNIGFNGTGDYLGPNVRGTLRNKRMQALNLANTLDAYNNNELCL